MYKVFVSHTSTDDPFVARLASSLKSAGVDVWIDSGRILPGDDILQKVEHALSEATHVIVVFSPSSLLSAWVREESHAAQLSAIAGHARLIPVIYGAMTPSAIPLLLRSRLFVDFRDPSNFDLAIAQLLSAFAPSDPSAGEVPSALQVIDFQIAQRRSDNALAIELLLRNSGTQISSINKVSLRSGIPYDVDYAAMPSTFSFPLDLTFGPRTSNGIAIVGGLIGHDAEDWRRPVRGQLVFAPYNTEFRIELPIYIAIGPREEVVLRISLEGIVCEGESVYRWERFSQTDTGEMEDPLFGTQVSIFLADRMLVSYSSPVSLLSALSPLLSAALHDQGSELEWRLGHFHE